MIPVIAVAVAAFFALAINLASTERFVDNLKRARILIPVLCVDAVYLTVNIVLNAMSLQLMPNITHFATIILTIVTVFGGLLGITRNTGAYAVATMLALVILFIGFISIPIDHGITELDGEEYVGISPGFDYIGGHAFIYYYKSKSPLVISAEQYYSEYYGVHFTNNWAEITKDGPVEINYYEDGRLVRTKPIYPWTK